MVPARKKKVAKRSSVRKVARRRASPGRNKRRASQRRQSSKSRSSALKYLSAVVGLGLLLLLAWTIQLDHRVKTGFATPFKRIPAHVYARPDSIRTGDQYVVSDLKALLLAKGYRHVSEIKNPGEFAYSGGVVDIYRLASPHQAQAIAVRLRISNGRVDSLIDHATAQAVAQLEFTSKLIGNLMTGPMEDRILLKLHEVPEFLLDALITMEDQRFSVHHGVDPMGIMRAMVQNLKSGRVTQGGSTLTQQLVKNLYLDDSRTLKRKLNEAVMALLIEWRYSKAEILERYLNTIFLGQSGNRAIHGFGLAAQFYYDRKLQDLNPSQIALLVGMIPAPSAYNPFRNADRARKRRNLVLKTLFENGYLSRDESMLYQQAGLGVVKLKNSGAAQYGAFSDLLNRQLGESFERAYLEAGGVNVYSTLDERVQKMAQSNFQVALKRLEDKHGLAPNSLQGAMIILDPASGEIISMVGSRKGRSGDFNRALDARRPIGSLVKPMVYLTALLNPNRYASTTMIDDSPLSVELETGAPWVPSNYDEKFHGEVSLYDALIHSYNVPAVKVGLDVGLDAVATTMHRLGIEEEIDKYPSMLLGSTNLSLFQVAQMYQTLANQGSLQPLTSLRFVADNQHQILTRHQSKGEQMVNAKADFLVLSLLDDVAEIGTARALKYLLPGIRLAGKTGTTNDYRDSWFAGFGENYLAVVWLGKDDNTPTGLTGASGALRVWAKVMEGLDLHSLDLQPPEGVTAVSIDLDNGGLAAHCTNVSEERFFIAGYEPLSNPDCRPIEDKVGGWLEKWFGSSQSSPSISVEDLSPTPAYPGGGGDSDR